MTIRKAEIKDSERIAILCEQLGYSATNDHKLEIHASDLETRIKTSKEFPWEGLEFFV